MAVFFITSILACHLLTLAGSIDSVPFLTLEVTATGTSSPVQYVWQVTSHATFTFTCVMV